jgi:hypothetical protein
MAIHPNLVALDVVAAALGPLLDRMMFVGGSTVQLYIDDPAAPPVRDTRDVDLAAEVTTIAEMEKIETEIRRLGFQHYAPLGGRNPICRWIKNGIIVDIVAMDPKPQGFSNPWYLPGWKQKLSLKSPSGRTIHLMPAPYFIGSKLTAFEERGRGDYVSNDFEDIAVILNGRTTIRGEIEAAPDDIRTFIAAEFSKFLTKNFLLEGIEGAFPHTEKPRAQRVLTLMRQIAALK